MPDKPDDAVNRKLLTLMAADVAGYSQAMSKDEIEALRQLSDLRAILDVEVEENGGRIANTAGDSVLAIFDSPVNAMQAAVNIQTKHSLYSKELENEMRLRFRIGLNIGDVVVQPNGDVLGHGVNIAARLESLAEPGGICLSENVREQALGKFDIEFTKVGDHYLKNIDAAVTVFAVGQGGRKSYKTFLHKAEKLGRSPAFVLAVLGFMVATVVAFVLFQDRQLGGSVESGADLKAFLESEPDRDELLSYFDLVTRGEFEGSEYFVIRTWGGDLKDLQDISRILGGYMVAIGSEEENQFVFELTKRDEGHWIVSDGQLNGPMIGLYQEDGAQEPDQGWRWMNGEPLVYTNWKQYGPENFGGDQSLAHFKNHKGTEISPQWNDMRPVLQSFIVEVPKR